MTSEVKVTDHVPRDGLGVRKTRQVQSDHSNLGRYGTWRLTPLAVGRQGSPQVLTPRSTSNHQRPSTSSSPAIARITSHSTPDSFAPPPAAQCSMADDLVTVRTVRQRDFLPHRLNFPNFCCGLLSRQGSQCREKRPRDGGLKDTRWRDGPCSTTAI